MLARTLAGSLWILACVASTEFGGVVLLHTTVFITRMLPQLIGQIRSDGFRFSALADVEQDPAYSRDPDAALSIKNSQKSTDLRFARTAGAVRALLTNGNSSLTANVTVRRCMWLAR
jgi:hypothetical protein